jgi:hypothetical protein
MVIYGTIIPGKIQVGGDNKMNRLFLREKDPLDKSSYFPRRKIGIIGLGPGCGVTSIGTTLAKIASKEEKAKIQYLEIRSPNRDKPLIFDALGMDKRFLNRKFIDYYKEVKAGNHIGHLSNKDEGIGWALVTKENVAKKTVLSTRQKIHLINNLDYDILICDLELGNEPWSEIEEEKALLLEMNRLILVIDALPSKLLGNYPLLQWVKGLAEKDLPVFYIVNKYNKGVQKRDFFDYIKLRPDHFITFLPAEDFYTCEYNCQLPHRIKDLRESLSDFCQNKKVLV